jgi:hypothetical protein
VASEDERPRRKHLKDAYRRSQELEIFAPIHALWIGVDEWLDSLPHDTSCIRQDIAYSPVFTEQSYKPGRAYLDRIWRFAERPSWLGGPALLPLPEWPRRGDGKPLAHVASISLQEVWSTAEAEDKEAFPVHAEGLPTAGYLEVFHDLVDTWGWQADERDAGGWLVRWVPEPEAKRLADPPADADPAYDACQAGMYLAGWSCPPPMDFRSDRAAFDAALAVQEAWQSSWWRQRTHQPKDVARPVTHVYGHSQNASAPALRVLRECLPLDEDDSYRLVLDIESATHLCGWFGDGASLEVWMRDSDLAASRFERAWCITRTD